MPEEPEIETVRLILPTPQVVRITSLPEIINNGGGGSAVWGSITGTLSNQTDLNTSLGLKVPTTRLISTTSPIIGGGDLGVDRTLSIPVADATHDGYLSSTDWNTFNAGGVPGAALTKTDDTNITLTLGGSPTTALVNAASLTLGWTGTLAVARGGTGAGTDSGARTNLGLVIGTNVQAWDTQLDSLSGLSYAGNTLKVIRVNAGETAFELATVSAGASGANPTASVGLVAVNGSAVTFLRSDGAPPLDVTISPNWSGNHSFTAGSIAVTTQSSSDNSTKAASTAYVTTAISNAIAGVNPAVAVQAATTVAGDTSGLIYSNGVSGIGATLTGSNNTAITFDGYTFTAVGQRALVKNDTQSPSGAFNGVYYVTQIQTAILPPILTRTLDFNSPSDINNTGAIPVVNGTLNGTTSWVLTSTVTTVGTDPLTFTEFSLNPTTIVTTSRTLTIAGTAQNLSADRTWTQDTITGLSSTGLVKRTGANTLSTITDSSTNWDTAFTQTRQWDGGATGLVAATGRSSLGATTVGSNIFTLTNPGAISFVKIASDNTVSTRTPTQVVGDLSLTIGTNTQAWDADLDTLAGLTATTDNFIVSVSSAWASRTPSQVRTTLGLVIGTNVQAWDTQLDSLAGLSYTGNTLKVVRVNAGETGFELAAAGSGVTSVATTSPITGGTITSTGTIALDVSVDHAFTAAQSATVTNAVTAAITDVLTLKHNSSGTPAAGFGTGIRLLGKSNTTNDRVMADISAGWTTATDASRQSYIWIRPSDSADLSNGVSISAGGMAVGYGVAPNTANGVIDVASGFLVNSAAVTGTFLIGASSIYQPSSMTLPASASTAGKLAQSNGSNGIIMSAMTWPTSVLASGLSLLSDGTNIISGTPAPITINAYGLGFSIPDTGNLNQPLRATAASTERITVAGTGRSTIFDPLNAPIVMYDKGALSPGSFILRDQEFMLQNKRISVVGNQRATMTATGRFVGYDYPANCSRLILSGSSQNNN